MILEKGKYIKVISHGEGRHYLLGPTINKLTGACISAKITATSLNKSKGPKAPKVRVTIMRIVEIYDE